MTYYKGLIVNQRRINGYKHSIKLGSSYYAYNSTSDVRIYGNYDYPKKIENKLKLLLYNFIKSKKDYLIDHKNRPILLDIKDDEIISCFNELFKDQTTEITTTICNLKESTSFSDFIVYELVKDREGNLFGRELYTKKLFPIYNSKCAKYSCCLSVVYGDSYEFVDSYKYYIEILPSMEVSSLLKCDNIIVGHKVADLNDYNRYMNKYRGKRLFKYQEENDIERYKQKIIKISNGNVFKEDFELEENLPKKEIVREKQSLETSLMEDIEFNLMKLKDVNKELYLEYKNKYEIILKEDVNREKLALLLGEIEYSIIFKKRNVESILDFINNLKEEYLNNFINNTGNKTDTDLKKLDKISELFLRIKDKFNLLDQRKVLRNLAFLYLMEVYENKDIISIEELENSYFSSNLKSIIIWINTLIEEDIIECDYLVSLRDDLNVEIVFDCIKNIRFKNKKFKK